ncbi:MAG: glycosyl hydrolase family 8, partial [Actinomycetota bacterium]|nr:glycosyl hydrolase family 8 [Actinomycetota bacterium]
MIHSLVKTLAAAVAAVLALLLVVVRGDGGGDDPRPAAPESGGEAPRAFFDRYLEADGRVVRRDQGGDTVSEGQAYAMLLAVAEGDERRFSTVWEWAQAHLQRDDALLSWHWADGRVTDRSSAADADLDAARALLAAGKRFSRPAFTEAGRRLARAILDHETAEADSRLALLAGPWATDEGVLNPSYFAPCAYADLAEGTGDDRWLRLQDDTDDLVTPLTGAGRLPPDWARLTGAGIEATGAPDGSNPPRYGPDAARLPIRLAEDCSG